MGVALVAGEHAPAYRGRTNRGLRRPLAASLMVVTPARRSQLLEQLRVAGAPTHEAEGALEIYASSLMHLLAHERKLKEEAEARKGETKLRGGHKKAYEP